MIRKFLTAAALATVIALPSLAPADDTDIYVDNNASRPASSEPLVMFSLDYRSNLTSTADAAVVGGYFCTVGMSALVNELSQINGGGVLGSGCATGSLSLKFFDTMILSLAYVMQDVYGVKIGFMFNHNDAGGTSGTASTPKCKGFNLSNSDCVANGLTAANKDCDNDTIRNDQDFCPALANSVANNVDPDGDLCGTTCDNCPGVNNPTQADADGDGLGDACDSSPDGAGTSGFTGTPTGSNGGVILMGFQSVGSLGSPTTAKTTFLNKLKALKRLKPQSNSPDHPYQGAELFYEFYRYLSGQGIYNGHNGVFDFEAGGDKNSATNMRCNSTDANLNPACWDSAIESGNNYVSPFASADACAKIFTVNFLFQVSQQEADASIFTTAKSSGGLGISAPSSQNDYFPAVLNFLHANDLGNGTFGTIPDLSGKQNVTSFFVVDPTKINNTTTAYAANGGTNVPLELASDPARLVATLRNIFEQILSVSTTLVAASVPVNVFNRSEIVDNVYFALFQAQQRPTGARDVDPNIAPGGPAFWPGNLKKLKLRADDVTDNAGNVTGKRLSVVDAKGDPAINNADGRIRKDARTFWTEYTGAAMDVGDTNSDGTLDAADGSDPDTVADFLLPPIPAGGTAANVAEVTTDNDGRYVTRGAAGQKIPGFMTSVTGATPGDTSPGSGEPNANGPRKVFYLTKTSSAAALSTLDVSKAGNAEIKTQLGNAAMSDATAASLIKYARGQDVNDDDADGNVTESRYWLLGDPLHSRPLPLNYGFINGHTSAARPAIYIAMATNDGGLHFFRNTTADAELGKEVWVFYPPEGLAVQNQLANMTKVGYTGPTIPEHPYSFDGEPTALVIDQNGNGTIESGDKVILYIGLRRGGSGTGSASINSAYYALDVTNPDAPVFLWRLTPTSRTTSAGEVASTDFAELGFTFSRPRVGTVNVGTTAAGAAVRRLAVIFGGGYDGGYTGAADGAGNPVRFGKDVDGARVNDSRGNALFVVRANNGELIWKAVGPKADGTYASSASAKVFRHASLRDGIASNVTVVDSDADGAIDRIVVGDTGGNVWRADLGPDTDGSAAPVTQAQVTDNWKLTRLACLGRNGGADCGTAASRIDDRRFFHEPDVIQAQDSQGRYDAVVIGSGDREDPLDQGGDVDNFLFVIKDRLTGIGAGVDRAIRSVAPGTGVAGLADITNDCLNGACTGDLTYGYRLALNHPNGEKSLSAPVTIASTVFFTTYLPPPPPSTPVTQCGPREGGGFLYAINLYDGSPRYNYDTSNGGTTSDDGTTASDRSVDLQTPGIPAQVVYLGSPGGSQDKTSCTVNVLAGAKIFDAPGCPRFRTFWQREGS